MSNIPNCFKKFSNVWVVLDCTEIFLQNWNVYHAEYPTGFVTCVSKPYCGRSSDNVIVEQSNLITLWILIMLLWYTQDLK